MAYSRLSEPKQLATKAVCCFLLGCLLSCKSDRPSGIDQDSSIRESPQRTHSEPSRLDIWHDKWKELHITPTEHTSKTKAYLNQARESLTNKDFVYLLELIAEGSSVEERIHFSQLLGVFALTGEDQKLPKWYHLLTDQEFTARIAYAMGTEVSKTKTSSRLPLLAEFKEKKNKSQFMLGFCAANVKEKPNSAFNEYLEWGAKNGALESFPKLIKKLPDNTDFAACDKKIPRSEAHIAVACRKAIYSRWADVNVVQLITHLINTKRFHGELYLALNLWGEKNPKLREEWMRDVVSSGRENPAWDTVRRIQAERIMAESPEKAWNLTREIRHETTREVLLRKVHAVWIKTDYKAADEARKEHIRRTPRKKRDGNPKT